ncbi:nucleotidyltransferase domain-containing protein [Nocardia sp. NPDC049149]|uniref:nucleotidyltransferase domain-containing protein n=1 Tax=Nocardia sp. NPDC049149 TaxID=3364315 RepID=UPI00371B0317
MPQFPVRTPCDTEEVEFQRLWGPWATVTPADVRSIVGDLTIPWWVSGGWALDAFTGSHRDHGDVDISMFRTDLPALRAALGDRLHIWSAGPDGLRPVNDQFELADSADQVWLRTDAMSPWLVDVLLNPDKDGAWVNKRDRTMIAPLEQVTWQDTDGIRYLNPDLVLIFKAKLARPKDRADLERTWPALDNAQRTTVRDCVARLHPGHAWLPFM